MSGNETHSELLSHWIIELIIGFTVCIAGTAILLWGPLYSNWFNRDTRLNSFTAMVLVYTLSTFSLHKFSRFMGKAGFRYIIQVFLFWLLMALTTLLVFRLPYSLAFLGTASTALVLLLTLFGQLRNRYSKQVIGYLPNSFTSQPPERVGITWIPLETVDALDRHINIVAADLRSDLSPKWEEFLAQCALNKIPVYHSMRLREMLSGRVRVDHMYENNLGSLIPSKSYQGLKRLMDICLVLISLPVLVPLMAITAVFIRMESPGGVLFRQIRVGQGGKEFTVYKFRSMYQGTEEAGVRFTQTDDPMITRSGKITRMTRIDELPQLINVLKGEMSLIGPRPERPKFVEAFRKEIPFYDYRHIIKPGISGWAQVEQGYAANTEATRIKLEYDFYYIKNFSLSLDLLIFFKTIQTVVTGFGAR